MQESYPNAVVRVHGLTIALENPQTEYNTIIKLYTDDELVFSMMNTLDKNIYETSIRPKDLVDLFGSGKPEFSSGELFDIIIAGIQKKSDNITTDIKMVEDHIVIKFCIQVILNIKREFSIIAHKKEQKDIDRICLIAQDIYDINQDIINEENLMKQDINQIYDTLNTVLRTNTVLYNQLIDQEKKYNELEGKFNALHNKLIDQEKMIELHNTKYNELEGKINTPKVESHNQQSEELENKLDTLQNKFSDYIARNNANIYVLAQQINKKKNLSYYSGSYIDYLVANKFL